MITSFIELDVLRHWVVAELLAIVILQTLMHSGIFTWVVERLEKSISVGVMRLNLKWFTVIFIGALLAAPLMILSGASPEEFITLHAGKNPLIDSSKLTLFSSPIVSDLLIGFQILVLLSTIPITNRFYTRIAHSIQVWQHTRFRVIKFQELEIFTPEQLANVMTTAVRYLKLGVHLLVASVCLTLLFSIYPVTEGLATALWTQVVEGINALWQSFLAFIPNLITLIAIGLIARAALKLLRFFYQGIRGGRIRYTGIHYELVEPTYQILRFLVVAFALVAAFPYIPGSSSPVFKGLSIFVGFLVSLGSTSLITNIVAGIVLTYSRGLKIGDRVKISDSMGDVVERTLLVTRVRTIKNEVVTIPNAVVLKYEIVNYSTDAEKRGLILHTAITIGYDIPWRRVHELLVNAAEKTTNILEYPSPFVLKTALEDSYIRYELNAYTGKPSSMAVTYSELHQNILDEFSKAGVEITSPSYWALRDGNRINIPEFEYSRNGVGVDTKPLAIS